MDAKRKNSRYQRIYTQAEELLKKSENTLAHMATLIALLHHKMDDFFWTGFYLHQDGQLIVGPYQGSVACQILTPCQGVCWAAVERRAAVVVPDVHQFPGHIACDSRSNSEITVPLFRNGEVIAVLDVDSKSFNTFDAIDAEWLTRLLTLIKV